MAIPFYENEEQSQQHQPSEEIDQVDGPANNPPNLQPPPVVNHTMPVNHNYLPTADDLMAWKVLALAMCKAFKDHYQQNITTAAPSNSNESSTAVIEISPNGQVKPSWN